MHDDLSVEAAQRMGEHIAVHEREEQLEQEKARESFVTKKEMNRCPRK
jgi:hypothetical protein